ncbi:VOC family protein [Nocardia goodfellowii]|uniref:2,3-dihydroxybiphenyl 1,2-dioxygenase n=1 Tax=Nocardia goodfellowii TaxID=882446 RepID=A0ABS4QNR2_9NOCA|nr:VOC family protein [Nocardia goodfellowii]MBP2192654.1 2,3-dihydroxybiphenyl 1,2-dioxygenase [Nocardia goodfellowii]
MTISSLGYVRVAVSDPQAWRTFAFDVLGFAEGTGPDPDALYLRMDERAARLVLVPGAADKVLAIGWEVRDYRALAQVRDAVRQFGIEVTQLPVAEADARRVEEVISFLDPAGTTVEVFHGPVLDHSPVVNQHGNRFVTEGLGLGHAVLPVPDLETAFRFYTEVLGFRPRGAFRLPTPPEHGPMRVRFLGVNQRHHSLALIPSGGKEGPGLVHIMVEVDALDDVGRALDRVGKAGYHLSSTLGRHTNDKMISFYVRTPGGWDLEFGTEGIRVDESAYTAEEITADSYWGHDWSR